MKKTIKTMQGKPIDFAELALRNEKVRAVGNMNVTADGEKVETKVIPSIDRNRRAGKSFRRQIHKKVFDTPVMESEEEAKKYIARMAEEYNNNTVAIESIAGIDKITVSAEVEKLEAMQNLGKPVMHTSSPVADIPTEEDEPEVSEELLQEVLNRPRTGGLANAIATAKKVKQSPIKTPREQLRAYDGVKKI